MGNFDLDIDRILIRMFYLLLIDILFGITNMR